MFEIHIEKTVGTSPKSEYYVFEGGGWILMSVELEPVM